MDRIFKYRAFDKRLKIMLYHKLGERHWYTEDNKAIIFDHNDHHETAIKKRLGPVMEWTGLVDKNNKEIYEGDLVKYDGKIEDGIAKVTNFMGKQNLYFEWLEQTTDHRTLTTHTDYFGCSSELEIIGNIYQNSEIKS